MERLGTPLLTSNDSRSCDETIRPPYAVHGDALDHAAEPARDEKPSPKYTIPVRVSLAGSHGPP
jgi:hypothetical protein